MLHLCELHAAHQRADTFTKALPHHAFQYLQSKISRWQDFARECHEHDFHDGIHKFPQQIVQIPATPISPCAKPETNLQPKLTTHNSSLASL